MSIRTGAGGGSLRAIRSCSLESSSWKGCMSTRRIRPWDLLKNFSSCSTACDAGHWLIMFFLSLSVGPAAGRHCEHNQSWYVAWSNGVQLGRYAVDQALSLDSEHCQLVFCILVGCRVGGRSIQVPAQGVAAEVPMYVCPSLPWGAE